MKLIIAEKPSVAQGIAKVVGANKKENGYMTGNGYVVSWCLGHLIQLKSPDSYIRKEDDDKFWNIEDLPIIPEKFEYELINDAGVKSQYKTLKGLLHDKNISEVICATDAGREGECIFRYVYNYSRCTKPTKRLWVSSMEEKAITEGMRNLCDDSEYDNLYKAGELRSEADWLIGMNLTRLYSIKYNQYKPVLSVGRVQSAVLAMIVKRYIEAINFQKKSVYKIAITANDTVFRSKNTYESESEAKEAMMKLSEECRITVSRKETKTTNPPLLYDLTLLQRHANALYGYTAQQTLDTCQKLYEGKLITYPRTDSNYLTEEMDESTDELIRHIRKIERYGKLPANIPDVKRVINNDKVSDHHALLPTMNVTETTFENGLNEMESDILHLICSRLMVATAGAKRHDSIHVETEINGIEFEANGTHTIDRGFTQMETMLGITKERADKELNEASVGETMTINLKEIAEVKIKPPALYTDASLLAAMETAGNDVYDNETEKKGIGTPATRASAIETLVSREYIIREKKKIIPTERGIKLVSILPKALKSPKTTASWEEGLQKIERGEVSEDYFINKIVKLTRKLVEHGKSEEVNTGLFRKTYESIGSCPVCGEPVLSYNKAYSCSNRECKFFISKTISGKNITETAAKNILEKGKSGKIKGFVSKKGEEYSGELYLDEDNELKIRYRK